MNFINKKINIAAITTNMIIFNMEDMLEKKSPPSLKLKVPICLYAGAIGMSEPFVNASLT